MRVKIIRMILDLLLFTLWSFVGVYGVVDGANWMSLIHGGLMTIYFLDVVNDVIDIVRAKKRAGCDVQ